MSSLMKHKYTPNYLMSYEELLTMTAKEKDALFLQAPVATPSTIKFLNP